MNQRDKMRELFQRYGDNERILIQKYALRLLTDARKKGWIRGLKE